MPITFPCPSCNRQLTAGDQHAGRTLNCPVCRTPVSVPQAASEWIAEKLEELKGLKNSGADTALRVPFVIIEAMASGRKDPLDSLVDAHYLRIDFKDEDGGILMHIAATSGYIGAMNWLKKKGLSVDAKRNDGDMPIHLAAGCGHGNAVKWLIDNGVDVNTRGQKGRMPMHQAAGAGKVDVMRYLKRRGADVGARDNGDLSPLDAAVANRQIESIKCLVTELGFNVDTKNSGGQTALFIAVMQNKLESVDCLINLVLQRNKLALPCMVKMV